MTICTLLFAGFSNLLAVEPAQVAIDLDRPFSGYALTAAYPGISFNEPVGVASPSHETNRLFIYERSGIIWIITNLAAPTKTIFLDLRKSTTAGYIETGLLGLAFHPGYKTNGHFYVNRMVFDRTLTQRLARFSVSANDPNLADPAETILIDHMDGNPNHNGGDLQFGPDGYLYFSVGDATPTLADRRPLPQAIDGGLFAGIFRIDVDQRPGNLPPNPHSSVIGNYSIPADNPFIGAKSFLGLPVDPARVRTEFFAVGLRNAWRFAFDDASGQLIAGDVGAAWVEEINLVAKGANYGWPYYEGEFKHELIAPTNHFNPLPPLHTYARGQNVDQGSCVIGGLVCRQAAIPDMEGWYAFADERSGNVWRLQLDDPAGVEWLAREPGIVSFGRDPATGDLLAVNFHRGEIRRLVFAPPQEQRVPSLLSATGVFSDVANLTVAPGFERFDVNVTFWSDHAIKRRWFGLMFPQDKIIFAPTNNWTFAHGAVWVKHFELEMQRGNPSTARRIETRLLLKSRDEFYGFTYRWNNDGRDAELVPPIGLEEPFTITDPGGILRTQVWIYPPRGDCAACHTKVGGGALAFNTAQLNLDQVTAGVPENQLKKLARLGYVHAPQITPSELPALAPLSDESAPVEYRLKSHLAANCVQCHQPGGVWGATWDASLLIPIAAANMINAESHAGLNEDSVVVEPNSLTNSMLLQRMSLSAIRMPPVGSTVLDDRARELVTEWILGMPDASLTPTEIGSGPLAGSSLQRDDAFVIGGIGSGMAESDRLHLLAGRIQGNGHVIARLASTPGTRPGLKAGIMLRDSASSNAPAVWLSRDNQGLNSIVARSAASASTASIGASAQLARPWMRLTRSDDHVTAWESADGISWQKLADSTFTASLDALAGIAVASGEDWRYATAEFDAFQILSVTLQVEDHAPSASLPKDLFLNADVQTTRSIVQRVEFFAGAELLATTTAPPWRFTWTNAWSGSHDLTAVVVDSNGLSITSAPVKVTLTADPPIATYSGSTTPQSNWSQSFATLGQAIPGVTTNLPIPASIQFTAATVRDYGKPGVLSQNNTAIPATAWENANELVIQYRPGNEVAHRLTLFFARYTNTDTLTVIFRNAANGAALDARTISISQAGQFESWILRGEVDIIIRANPGFPAVLNGLFWSSLPKARVILQPISGPITLPAAILLQAEASAADRAIRRVEFWSGAAKLGDDSQAPFEFRWTNALAGDHLLTAAAVDEFGLVTRSEPIAIRCLFPSPAAVFIGEDRATHGDWTNSFGRLGQAVVVGWTNLPPSLTFAANGEIYAFDHWNFEPAALRWPDVDARLAACYFNHADKQIELRTTALDGRPTRLALYFLDWFGPGRAQEIILQDAATGAELDLRTVDSFTQGSYLIWNIRGDVRVLIRSINDFNVVLSAAFFDPPATEINLTAFPNLNVTLPQPITLRAQAPANAGFDRIDFFADDQRIASITNAPYEFTWTNAFAGQYTFAARAIGYSGLNANSPTLTLTAKLPPASATFVQEKRGIAGNWWKAFGADGFQLPTGIEQLRDDTRLTHGPLSQTHQWSPASADERGVFVPEDESHLAASWYSVRTYDATAELLDGRERLFAMYFLDYERVGAGQTALLKDAGSGAILDERLIEDMGEGVYLAWKIRGRVHIEIVRGTKWAALTSGIFFGGPIVNSQFWWASHFGGDLLATPNWYADPDGDSRVNMVEYTLGSDPMSPEPPVAVTTTLEDATIVIELNVHEAASDAPITLETSTDLATWRPAAVTRADIDDHVRFTAPAVQTAPTFYRVRFAQP